MQDKNAIIGQRPITDDLIHVALAVYDPKGTYSQHAGVTITSIFENTKSKVMIHILHDDTLTEDNRKKFIRTAEKYNQPIEFNDITVYRNKIGSRLEKISEKWTIGTLFRMFVPEALSSVDKVIYLDCDIVVNLDILELWNIDLEGKSIAGAPDTITYKYGFFFDFLASIQRLQVRLMGHDVKSYINAGVSVMNLKKIRERENFADMCIQWITEHSYFNLLPDQDAINIIFMNDIKHIDAKFNIYDYTHETKDCIIHMFAAKPWEAHNGSASENCYWKMYLKSAWGENVSREDLIDTFSRISASSGFYHGRFTGCIKRLLNVTKKRILEILGVPVFIFRHIIHQVKRKFTS